MTPFWLHLGKITEDKINANQVRYTGETWGLTKTLKSSLGNSQAGRTEGPWAVEDMAAHFCSHPECLVMAFHGF